MSTRGAVIGSINADLSVNVERHPLPGETVLGSGGELSPGGKGGNQALASARQGAETIMIGAIGTDSHAEVAARLLRAAGVDLTHVSTTPGPPGLAIVAVDPCGETTSSSFPEPMPASPPNTLQPPKNTRGDSKPGHHPGIRRRGTSHN